MNRNCNSSARMIWMFQINMGARLMVKIPFSMSKCANHLNSSDMWQLRTHSIFFSTLQRKCINKISRKHFYCQDYISPQNACQTNQIDEVRVGFMQQASRWGEHDRGKPYHYYMTWWTSLRSSTNKSSSLKSYAHPVWQFINLLDLQFEVRYTAANERRSREETCMAAKLEVFFSYWHSEDMVFVPAVFATCYSMYRLYWAVEDVLFWSGEFTA